MPKKPIYLDYNATTPVDPRVADAMLPYLTEHFGNPSSSHIFGRQTRQAIDTARKQVADMLRAEVDEIIFTSGGSEANNFAIKGAALAQRGQGNHIITTQIEHPAVLEVCAWLERNGFKVTYLPVDGSGLISVQAVQEAITPQTILITVMHANNEIGTIQPIAEIAALARERGILMHSDCAQSVGKIPVWVDDLKVDLLSVAGHKLYAPKGVGALYVRRGVELEKQIHGADHERNLRAGTENVLEIVGLGKACELVGHDFSRSRTQLQVLRDYLQDHLLQKFSFTRANGDPDKRLPNTASISFRGIEANTIVARLNETVAVSAGAACHAEDVQVSQVLQAIDLPLDYAMGTIRFSVGRFSTREELDRALVEIDAVISELQPQAKAASVPIANQEIKLTQFTHGLGCACKLRPQLLEAVLQKLPRPQDANILVGNDTADDAAVYRLDDNTALVQTVDFFTPVVDDPFDFGRIAAANALSDVYAMGARPLLALNIVGFPSNRLPQQVLEQILLGAQQVAEQAGMPIVGGHTVDDTEPKFGLAVSGLVHPRKIWQNGGARPGDALILTKPLGSGILATALKNGLLNDAQSKELVTVMAGLNKSAAEIFAQFEVHACTDITGFGLLGHLRELLIASGSSARLDIEQVPFLDGALDLAAGGSIPGGTRDNFTFTRPDVEYADGLGETRRLLLNDAQTSGGLLVAIPADQAEQALTELRQVVPWAAAGIGKVIQDNKYRIYIK